MEGKVQPTQVFKEVSNLRKKNQLKKVRKRENLGLLDKKKKGHNTRVVPSHGELSQGNTQISLLQQFILSY
jgi:hypothetical protein